MESGALHFPYVVLTRDHTATGIANDPILVSLHLRYSGMGRIRTQV